ncbi:pilus assembly protein TadG-related protein [Candidatus Omnitrophota bacterium]
MNRIIYNWISWARIIKPGRIVAKNIYKLWQIFLRRQKGSVSHILTQVGINVSGQISTLLILVMVVLLILILVVVNVGDLALKTTTISNAADSAALQLGSQLSNMAYVRYAALGDSTQYCKSGGLLSILSKIIGALAFIGLNILFPVLGTGIWAAVAAGAIGGAVGGGAASAIQGTNFWAGVASGAIVGASIGFCAGGALAVGPEAATSGLFNIGTSVGTSAITTAELASMVLMVGADIATHGIMQSMQSDAAAALTESLGGLTEREALREGTFLNALLQVVDDPNKGQDVNDSDGDGDTNEMVPDFQDAWYSRVTNLKLNNSVLFKDIEYFWRDKVANFVDYLKDVAIPSLGREGIIDELELEDGSEGPVVYLLRTLYEYENPVGSGTYPYRDAIFWQPGPTQEQIDDCADESGCPDGYLESVGYDSLDWVMDQFKEFAHEYGSFLELYSPEALAPIWESWISWFYQDAEAPGYVLEEDSSYNTQFDRIVNGDLSGDGGVGIYNIGDPSGWWQQIEAIRSGLAACVIDPATGLITNSPCQTSVDTDTDDEFAQVLGILEEIKNIGSDFQADCLALGTKCEVTGDREVVYAWDDTAGFHSVKVEVGNFPIPNIPKPTKTGNWLSNEKCWTLEDYSDGDRTWVKITREDPSDRAVGILGLWKTGIIERRSRVLWNYSTVSLKGL